MFIKHALNYEIIIIDDSSPDGTIKIAERLQNIYGKEKIIIKSRPEKLGLGSAYKSGFELSTGDYIIILDADLSHHPKFIPEFITLQKNGDYDIVTGSRYMDNGGVCGWNLRRKLTSRVANFFADTLLWTGLTDLTGSYRLYKRQVFQKCIEQSTSTGYVFQMEILVRAQANNFKIGECPITFVDRIHGESKLGIKEIIKYIQGVFYLFYTT